jgi:hypothetical protein
LRYCGTLAVPLCRTTYLFFSTIDTQTFLTTIQNIQLSSILSQQKKDANRKTTLIAMMILAAVVIVGTTLFCVDKVASSTPFAVIMDHFDLACLESMYA